MSYPPFSNVDFHSVASAPAPCQPVRGGQTKAATKTTQKDTRTGDHGVLKKHFVIIDSGRYKYTVVKIPAARGILQKNA